MWEKYFPLARELTSLSYDTVAFSDFNYRTLSQPISSAPSEASSRPPSPCTDSGDEDPSGLVGREDDDLPGAPPPFSLDLDDKFDHVLRTGFNPLHADNRRLPYPAGRGPERDTWTETERKHATQGRRVKTWSEAEAAVRALLFSTYTVLTDTALSS